MTAVHKRSIATAPPHLLGQKVFAIGWAVSFKRFLDLGKHGFETLFQFGRQLGRWHAVERVANGIGVLITAGNGETLRVGTCISRMRPHPLFQHSLFVELELFQVFPDFGGFDFAARGGSCFFELGFDGIDDDGRDLGVFLHHAGVADAAVGQRVAADPTAPPTGTRAQVGPGGPHGPHGLLVLVLHRVAAVVVAAAVAVHAVARAPPAHAPRPVATEPHDNHDHQDSQQEKNHCRHFLQ